MTRDDEFIKERLGGDDSVWNRLQYDRDGIIEASAGTGKTYTLQNIVLKFASEGFVDCRNVLLVTYTEKAAGELKQRIREVLEKAGLLPPDFDEMTICTIHSFCRELLSEYAFENRVPMQLEIGGSDGDLIHRAVREAILGDEFRARYGKLYGTYMEAAGLYSSEDLVAAAEKVLDACVKSDQPPETPQCLDETMKESLRHIVGRLCPSGDYCNLGNELGISRLPINGTDNKGFVSDFTDFVNAVGGLASHDEATAIESLMKCREIRGRGSNRLNPRISKPYSCRLVEHLPVMGEMIAAIDSACSALATQLVSDLSLIAWPIFRRIKDEAAMLTFDDLVTQAYNVVKGEADCVAAGGRSALLDSIRRRYRIALVDEFQDTDEKQWAVFGNIFSSQCNRVEDGAAPNPRQGFLLVVGDPKQAIYSFRGADIKTYFSAKREIVEKGQPKQSLNRMVRSVKPLVDAFNKLFGEGSGWFGDMGEGYQRIESPLVEYPDDSNPFPGLEDLTGRGEVTLLESLPPWMLIPKNSARIAEASGGKGDKPPKGCGNTQSCLPVFMGNAAREMKRLRALDVAYRTDDPDEPGKKSE